MTGAIVLAFAIASLDDARDAPSQGRGAQATTMTVVAGGSNSGVTEPKQVVVRTAAEWNALWKTHAAEEPAPAIDFSKELVAAVFLGTRPTGGFRVEIIGARLAGEELIVEYEERRPAAGAIVTQALTTPFHIVRVSQHEGPVRFETRAANRAR